MSIKAIRKSVKRSHEQLDEFEDGDVVRWVVRGRSSSYTYAALKTAAGWFTTATTASPVEQVVDFDRLLEILSGPCVERIDVVAGAEPWTVVFEAHPADDEPVTDAEFNVALDSLPRLVYPWNVSRGEFEELKAAGAI